MKNWYAKTTTGDQGLVIDEDTGETIAVTYKAENAPIVAAAPDLLDALELALYSNKADWRAVAYLAIEKAKHGS